MSENHTRIRWVYTTLEEKWVESGVSGRENGAINLSLTGEQYQKIEGFGGCFNELGWIALMKTDEKNQNEILDALFDPKAGCRFNFCRLPVGANDYAEAWYSYNENEGDYAMEQFSIERDRSYIIPYVNSALKRNSEIRFFASPWSPPTWMKYPKAYNFGTLIWEEKVLKAYTRYFIKYIQEYKKEGIKINQLHIQNEPGADQKFPSCVWTGEQMRDFIRDYLGPEFEKDGIDTEIWLGTLNVPGDSYDMNKDYDHFANLVLADEKARQYIAGVGYQWGGKNAIQRTYESWPEIRLMQTENECGDGKNTWSYAMYIFNLMKHYLTNGVESYIYWNMILQPGGLSTWGWKQNSMITIDNKENKVIYNPEFYLMKHFSHFIPKDSVRLGIRGHLSGNTVAFMKPNGEIVLVVSNPFPHLHKLTFGHGEMSFEADMKPYSFNTFVLQG